VALYAGSKGEDVMSEYIRFTKVQQTPTVASLSEKDRFHSIMSNAERIVAVWRQQPDNVTALKNYVGQVCLNLHQDLSSDSAALKAILDTYKPAPPAGTVEQQYSSSALGSIESKCEELNQLVSTSPRDPEAACH
jgi:hypothetical protein